MIKQSGVISTLLALYAGACVGAEPSSGAANLPEKLKPGANEPLAIVVPAKGVQIYECRASQSQPGTYEWAFVAPEADLFDAYGKRIGRHYGGPHWESTDGSKILGSVKERAEAPAAGAVPWLLLATKSAGAEGLFSKVTSMVRANTVGGVAPRSGCSEAAAGTSARVAYTADYYFFGAVADARPAPYSTGSRY